MELITKKRLTNADFLKAISRSFEEFINSGTSRSTIKLKPLHGAIAYDIASMLGDDYEVISQGYGEDRETKVEGRYYDKWIDIGIRKEGKVICGIAVKFVMQNYSQNSNNYFENMLGETANIRSGKCPYFQVFIILDKLPYYKNDSQKSISKWEEFTYHNAEKYVILSKDNIETFLHTPNKTLIYVVHIPEPYAVYNKNEYLDFYRNKEIEVTLTNKVYKDFGEAVIFNDYEEFMKKVYYTIMSL